MSNPPIPLLFDIPSLDDLVVPHHSSDEVSGNSHSNASVCIVGPDGVGKSILALHLAARYAWSAQIASSATSDGFKPKIIYVSTDYSSEQADRAWSAFKLGQPKLRRSFLQHAYGIKFRDDPGSLEVKLSEVDATPEGLQEFLEPETSSPKPEVAFVDLQKQSTGDDWLFLNRLLGALPTLRKPKSDPPHLLIVDAVEGLEIYGGRQDSFGQPTTRRGRLARLMQLRLQSNCHIALIVEEPKAGGRLPEQFVTDLVVRLRLIEEGDYARRTIEIEKARWGSHVRGQHGLSIRSGRGSSTGGFQNPDEPAVLLDSEPADSQKPVGLRPDALQPPRLEDDPRQPLAHVQVVHSVHAATRLYFQEGISAPDNAEHDDRVRFGHILLDRLVSDHKHPGLPAGTVTALAGDAGTYKSRLARAFLAQAFDESAAIDGSGVAILLTTYPLDLHSMSKHFRSHWVGRSASLIDIAAVERRILCRRFNPQFLSSGDVIAIVRQSIWNAQRALLKWDPVSSPRPGIDERRNISGRIRLVIDDWNQLLHQHPSLESDHLLLSSLLSFLQHEGVSTLIVSTQSGRPGNVVTHSSNDLRSADVRQILTWNVHFYGAQCAAISTMPAGSAGGNPIIYELRPSMNLEQHTIDRERIDIDRRFELYSGLEVDRPERVPLVVRLYTGFHTVRDPDPVEYTYLSGLKQVFAQLFRGTPERDVVVCEDVDSYLRLASFMELMGDSRLDYSLVFQVDEFWSDRHNALLDLESYLDAVTWEPKLLSVPGGQAAIGQGKEDEDSHGDFVPQQNDRDIRGPRTRRSFFNRCHELGRHATPDDPTVPAAANPHALSDRVPYLWDFGFLMARKDLFWAHRTKRIQPFGSLDPFPKSESASLSVGSIWDALCCPEDRLENHGEKSETPKPSEVTWEAFFQACRIIHSAPTLPFDVDMRSGETFPSLVLEVWASEVEHDFLTRKDNVVSQNDPDELRRITESTEQNLQEGLKGIDFLRRPFGDRKTLRGLLTEYAPWLYVALFHLSKVCGHLRVQNSEFERRNVTRDCVAARHYYSTACVAARGDAGRFLRPLRNPGFYSTRGDWALGVARGSRSPRLSMNALDVLTSRRMNLLRMQDGLGLPVRDVIPARQSHSATLEDVDSLGMLRTALLRHDQQSGRTEPIKYGELLTLAAGSSSESAFHWLWRSKIQNYDHQTFQWRRWLGRILAEEMDIFPETLIEFRKTLSSVACSFKVGAVETELLRNPQEARVKKNEMTMFQRFLALRDLLLNVLID